MNFLFQYFFALFSIEPSTQRYLQRWFTISLLLIVVTAFCSEGFYHFDEHWQILEFLGLKLGLTSADVLPWEYHFRMRSWSQPALYYLLSKLFFVQQPLAIALLARLVTGLLGWYALSILLIGARSLYRPLEAKLYHWAIILGTLCWYGPFLRVRPSSESLGTTFIILALVVLWGQVVRPTATNGTSLVSYGWAGFLAGLAFLFRYQLGFSIFFMWLWMIFFLPRNERKIKKLILFATAVLIPILLEMPINRWGYGQWVSSPWNYFFQNLVLDKASNFATYPFWYLITEPIERAVPPLGLILVAGQLLFWCLAPRHLLTWTFIPLFLIHSLIAAKAVRYIFPIALVTPVLLPYVHAQCAQRWSAYRQLCSRRLVVGLGVCLLVLNLGLLTVACLKKANGAIGLYRYVFNHPEITQIYSVDNHPYEMITLDVDFYRPPSIEFAKIKLPKIPSGYIFAQNGQELQMFTQAGCELIYSSYPRWLSHFNFFNWQARSRTWSLSRCP